MENGKLLERKYYETPIKGISIVSDNMVTIIGEQKVEFEDGEIVEQYLYNIDGYETKNGLPFVSHKGNIVLI